MDKVENNIICLCDTKGIQNYLFAKPTAQDIIAANQALHYEFIYAIDFAIHHMSNQIKKDEYIIECKNDEKSIEFLHSEKIKIQLVSFAAGNAVLLFRGKQIYEQFSRYIQLYFAHFGSILSMAIVGVEMTDDFTEDNRLLYQKLEELKANMPSCESACTFPIMKKEKYTGLPAVEYDSYFHEWISEDSKHSRKHIKNITLKKVDDFYIKNKQLAYVHIDGNNLGMKIASYKSTIKDYETSLLSNRVIDKNICAIYETAYQNSIKWFYKFLAKENIPADQHYLYYREINSGGDDINFVVNPKYALKFVIHLMKTIANNKTSLFDGDKNVRNSTCAGIAYVNSYTNFGQACDLAVQCCDNAKDRAKQECNLIDGQVGNWLDFQFYFDDNINDIDYLRQDSKSMDGAYNLMLRPYCIDPEFKDHPCHFNNFDNIVKAIFVDKVFQIDREKAMDVIKQGKYEVDIFIKTNLLNGKIKKTFYKDSIVQIPGSQEYSNYLYDALEYGGLYV